MSRPTLPSLTPWFRERELAGDARAGSYTRVEVRKVQRRYLRRNWQLFAMAGGVALVPLLVAVALAPDGFSRGFLLGAGLAAMAGAASSRVLQVTGTGHRMMGDQAEQGTASELRTLRRQGWRLVNHFTLEKWDIDHVLVGPGGAYAVETKWRSTPPVLTPPDDDVRRAAQQAMANARVLRLWAGLRAAGVADVRPLVVLWGPGSADLTPGGPLDVAGVAVVGGPSLDIWLDRLPTDVLTAEQVSRAWSALDEQVGRRDTYELAHLEEPVPRSMHDLAGTALATAAAASSGVVAVAALVSVTGSIWPAAALGVCLAVAPHRLRRRERWRLPVLGWQTGILGVLAAAGCSVLVLLR